MEHSISQNHPLRQLFLDTVRRSVSQKLGTDPEPDVEGYLTGLLLSFLHTDRIFAVKDAFGRRLISITDMMAEGDVLLNADSFERERQVHKHIGDFILFWSGVYPEFLRRIKLEFCHDIICDYVQQGKQSYHLVSTFDSGPYSAEAPTFRKLSAGFEVYSSSLNEVRRSLSVIGD